MDRRIKTFLVSILVLITSAQAMEERENPSPSDKQNDLNQQFADTLRASLFSVEKLEMARELLDYGVDIDGGYKGKYPFISLAMELLIGQENLLPLILLLDHGASINAKTESGRLPLAIVIDHLPLVHEEKGVKTIYGKTYSRSDWRTWGNQYDSTKPQWLYEWTAKPRGPFGKVSSWQKKKDREKIDFVRDEILDWFVARGAQINASDNNESILTYVSKKYLKANSDVLRCTLTNSVMWLVAHGALPDGQPDVLKTFAALYSLVSQAIIFNDQDQVVLCINELSKSGKSELELKLYFQSFLDLASARGGLRIVSSVFDKVQISPLAVLAALQSAATVGDLNVVKELLAHVDTTISDFKGCINFTLLHAVAQGRYEVVKYILDQKEWKGYFHPLIWREVLLVSGQLGYFDVFKILYSTRVAPYSQLSPEKLADEDTKKRVQSLFRSLNEVLLRAAVRGNGAIVEYLLDSSQSLPDMLDSQSVERRIDNILLHNPLLSEEAKQRYTEIKNIFQTFKAKSRADTQASHVAHGMAPETLFLQSL